VKRNSINLLRWRLCPCWLCTF